MYQISHGGDAGSKIRNKVSSNIFGQKSTYLNLNIALCK